VRSTSKLWWCYFEGINIKLIMLGVEVIKPNVGPTLIQIRTQGVWVGWFCRVVLHAFFFVTSGFACFQTQTFVWTRYKDLINDHNINSMAWGVRTKGVCLVVYIVMCFGVHIYSTCIDVSESYMINIDQSVPCTSIKYTELLYSDSLSYYECHTTLVNELCEFQFCSVPSSN